MTAPITKRSRQLPLVGGQAEIAGILAAVRAGRCCRLIGPRYHHKSQIMRAACEQIDQQLGFVSLYVSLWEARITSDDAFYTSLRDLIAGKISRYYRRRLSRLKIYNPADLTSYLSNLPGLLKAHVVLFIDDLEAAAPDYFSELLKVLRAAYQSGSADWQFLAVVCASHSLARSALGPTSPFENISDLVVMGDFSAEETAQFAKQQVAEAPLAGKGRPRPTQQALQLLYEQTGGDRALVREVCREYCLRRTRLGKRRLTPKAVTEAIESLVLHGGREALLEGLQQIENDPDLLREVLRLMREHEVPSNEVHLDPAVVPDPLTTSGFVRLVDRRFSIKSDLHHRLLERHFTPERVGRIFLAAGDWEAAIHYLGAEIRTTHQAGAAEERARVMLGAVSTMYSVGNKREALGYLARGFVTAYPQAQLRLFDFDKERNALIPIDLQHPTATPKRAAWLPLNAHQQPEVRALRNLQEFWLQPGGSPELTLYVPLRPSAEDLQGLAVIGNFISRADFRRKHEQMMEMVGYLRHAARALKNRAEHESLTDRATQRAQDLQNLLKWLLRLMNFKGSYDDILDHTLRSAVHALSNQAQMGSIYLYDRTTGQLIMRADNGYPPEIRAAAKFAPGKGLVGYVYKTGRLWNVRDTANDPHYLPLAQTPPRYQVKSSIGVPLRGRSGLIGVLCLDNLKRTRAFDEQSEQLLTLFASEVSPWLTNARLVNILSDLHATALELLGLSSPDSLPLLETVAQRLLDSFNLSICVIGLRVSPWQLRRVVQLGLAGLPETIELEKLPARLQQEVLTAGRLLVVGNLHEEAADWAASLGVLHTAYATLTTVIALPLRDDQAQHSLLLLGSVGEFTPSLEELNLLQTFANQLALALENAGLYRKVHVELQDTIDDLRQANRRLELLREQEVQFRNARLATGLLHQINNAVANIPELVDEIDRSWTKTDRRPLIELRGNAVAVSNISHWLHQFVRLGNLTLAEVDLAAVIQEAQQKVQDRRPPHVAAPDINLSTPLPRVRADRALLEILFENLLRNAYEALPAERPGWVRVELEATPPECIVRVADNGTGIPLEERDRIWEWGFSTKQPDRNTHDRGLGLFACKQIVDGHAGSIELEASRTDEGSIFVVRLPIAGPPHIE